MNPIFAGLVIPALALAVLLPLWQALLAKHQLKIAGRARSIAVQISMHSHARPNVSGVVVRGKEGRIRSQTELSDYDFIFVCRDRIGHEILEDLRSPSSRIKVLDTSNIADIIQIGSIENSRCGNSR
jgi:hypothetical protein